MLGFGRLSIQSKMVLLLLAVSLASIAAIAVVSYQSGKAALTKSVLNQLQGVRVAKTTALKTRLESLRDQVISMSDSQLVINGITSLRDAFKDAATKTLSPEEEAKLKAFYEKDFIPELSKNITGQPVLEQYLPGPAADRYLQYHYLAANPHPYGQKQELVVSETDKSAYAGVHAGLHKLFARAVSIFGFEDIMLVDPANLEIVYTYQKTTEFATNLDSGPYTNTKLAAAVNIMRNQKDRDSFKIVDFEPYRPSLGKPMGFAISPIFNGPQMIGLLLLQFPITGINQVVTGDFNWAGEGLGETGECYLVGPDKTMRTRSRFMYQDPKGFVAHLREAGTNHTVVNLVERQGNVMGVLPVNSSSVEKALRGQSGINETIDYRGEEVLSAYGPVELNSLRWAVIAEMDLDEANAPIHELGKKVVMVATGLALAVALLALICAHLLTRPLRLLTEGAKRLGSGETNVKVHLKSRDEFGELGRVFNEMAESIQSQTDKLEKQVQENQELLLSILPASAVAQRQEGDEKASRQFTDVSVLFSELIGMEEFGAVAGETRALSILGDLIAAFDEAAERSGIEKVKTIGGSYLAACGLSVNRPDHIRRIVQFAQEMVRIVHLFNRDHKAGLSIAVGINSGPVAGGVVGRRKFLYDLWGDTVTIAKQLAGGRETAIRVTGELRGRMAEQFAFSGPVRLEVEGKPPVEAWQVTS